jgi:hypothetical protein
MEYLIYGIVFLKVACVCGAATLLACYFLERLK